MSQLIKDQRANLFMRVTLSVVIFEFGRTGSLKHSDYFPAALMHKYEVHVFTLVCVMSPQVKLCYMQTSAGVCIFTMVLTRTDHILCIIKTSRADFSFTTPTSKSLNVMF